MSSTPSSLCTLEHSSPDATILAMISQLDRDFLGSIWKDTELLVAFMNSFSSLDHKIEMTRETLSEETLRIAQDFCMTVEAVASSMLDLDAEVDTVSTGFAAQLGGILVGVNNLSLNDNVDADNTEWSSPKAPYVKSAFQWLLSNLHNPYPSKEARWQIASSNNTSQRLVDAWFVDARKRIGWNKICKEHFSTNRKDMVNAATHFFQGKPVASTSIRPVEKSLSTDELAFIFISLENNARGMYSGKFSKSFEVGVTASCRGHKRSEGRGDARPLKRKRHTLRGAYPSPPASTHCSPEPASPSRESSQECEEPIVPIVSSNTSTYRPPSPTSTAGPSSPVATATPLVTSPTSHPQPLSSKRKRSTSCERQAPSPKRARRTVSAPTAPSLEPAYNPALEALTMPFQVESADFGIETPPSVAAVPLGENVEWDTSRFQQFVASLQREETPELSEYGSSSSSASSPGLSASPSLESIPAVEAVDFTTFSDPSSQTLLAVEAQPLIFETNYTNIYDSSQDMFSSLLEPSGQYDGPLPPLNMMPNTWMQELEQENLNTWCLPHADKTYSSLSDSTEYLTPQLTLADDRNAKLLRAQQLREELRQLEHDIHA